MECTIIHGEFRPYSRIWSRLCGRWTSSSCSRRVPIVVFTLLAGTRDVTGSPPTGSSMSLTSLSSLNASVLPRFVGFFDRRIFLRFQLFLYHRCCQWFHHSLPTKLLLRRIVGTCEFVSITGIFVSCYLNFVSIYIPIISRPLLIQLCFKWTLGSKGPSQQPNLMGQPTRFLCHFQ